MNTGVLFIFFQLFMHRSNSDPEPERDIHIHVHVPPDQDQKKGVFGLMLVHHVFL